jgi:fibronectin-binding autotransporter adhesin
MKTPPSNIPRLQCSLLKKVLRRTCGIAPKILSRVCAAALAMFALFGFNPQSIAATWTGSAGASDWATAADWGGTALASGNAIVFTSANASPTATLNNDETAFSIAGITFNSGSPAYTITGNSFALTGAIVNSSVSLQTLSTPITEAATETYTTLTGGGNITIGGTLSGAGGITQTGSGVLTLTTDNLTGNITLGAASTTGGAAGAVTINGGTFGSASATLTDNEDGDTNALIMNAGTATFATVSVATAANESAAGLTIAGGSATITTTTIGSTNDTAGAFNVTGGTVSLGAVTIVKDWTGGAALGTGVGLVINGSTAVATANTISVSSGQAPQHEADLNVDAGSLTIGTSASTGAFKVGANAGDGDNAFTVTGGTVTYAGLDGLQLGSDSFMNMSGGTANLSAITVDSATGGNGTSELKVTGGTLYLGGATSGVGLVVNSPSGTDFAQFGNATVGATTAWTSAAPITLDATDTTTFQAANSTSTAESIGLSGVISGSGALKVTGPGTVTMSQSVANTYSGATTVAGGTLEFGTTFAQSTGPSAITVNSGATLAAAVGGVNQFTNGTSGAGTLGGLITTVGSGFQSGSFIGIDTTAGSVSYAGAITTAGLGVTKLGANTLTLTAADTYTGATNVNVGTLAIGSGGSLGDTAITVANNASFQVLPALGTVTIGVSAANLTLAAGSKLLLAGNNAATGETTTFNTVNLNGGLTIGGATASAGLTFDINNADSDILNVFGAITFGVDGGVINIITPSGSTAPSGTTESYTLITGASGLGTGSLTLALGSQIITLGSNQYDAILSNSTPTSEILTLDEVSLSYYWVGNTSSSWSAPGNFATDHTGASFQSSPLGSTNNVILTADSPSGTNTASQTLDNSYTINSLSFSATAPAVVLGTGSLGNGVANTLTLAANNGFAIVAGASPITTNYAAGIGLVVQNGSPAQTLNVPIALGGNQTWEIDSANALTANGVISNGGSSDSLNKTGAGTLILGAADLYSGGTTVSAGTLALAAGGSLLSTGALTVQGGTFDLAGNSQTIGTLSDGSVNTGAITSSAGTPTFTVSSGTFSGAITGSLALTENGSSTLTLSGANSYTGLTTVSSGTLIVSNNSALGSSSSPTGGLALAGTAIADFTSSIPSIASLSGVTGNSIVLGNGTGGTPTTLTVTGAGSGSGTTFAGIISDKPSSNAGAVGNLTVSGGSLTLTAANTFTGTTLVSGGTLTLGNLSALENSTLSPGGGTISFGTLTAVTLGGLTGSTNLSLTNGSAAAVNLTIGNNNVTSSYSGNLTGSGNLSQIGTGVTTLGNDDLTGNITAGQADVTGGAAGGLTINGGTFGSATSTLAVDADGNGTAVILGGGTGTFQNVNIAITGGQTGAGMRITGGTDTFTNTTLGSSGDVGGNLSINTTGTVALGNFVDGKDTGGSGVSLTNGLEVQGGTVTATSVNIEGNTHSSNLNITGGSFTIGTSISSAAFQVGTSGVGAFLSMSGGALTYLGTDGLLLGNSGTGIGVASITGGTATLTGVTLKTSSSTVSLGLSGGATLYLGSVGLVENQPNSVTFGNATVGAIAPWSSTGAIALTGTTNFQAADSSNNPNNISLGGALSGAGGLKASGAGSLTLSGASGYTGATTVTGTLIVTGALNGTTALLVNGGTAELESPTALNSSAHVTLAAGTLVTLAGQTNNLSDLTLGAGSSTLTLGATASVINFADSSADTWTGTLAINDWNGNGADLNGGGSDQIFIGATADLSPAQLADITFVNPTIDGVSYFTSFGAEQLADGELIAAVPEPGTWASLLGGFGMLIVWQRSRRRRC